MKSGTARGVYALAAAVGVAALGAGLAFGTHLVGANSTSSAQLLSGAPNGITRAVAGNVQRHGKPTPKKTVPKRSYKPTPGTRSSSIAGNGSGGGGGTQMTGCAPAADQTMANTISHRCGFPDTTTSGVQAGVALRSVPGQVSKGPGWSSTSDGDVEVTGNGAVLSDLSIYGTVDVTASNVTINNVRVVASGPFAIDFRHTSNDTIENSTISGADAASGRVDAAVADVYGDSTGLTIKNDNMYWFRSAVQITAGLVTENYIHDPGYISGDHTNGVISNAGGLLTISQNTILISQEQTDCVSLNDSQDQGTVISNRIITDNLLAGGTYPIYGGSAFGNSTSHIIISDNHFSRIFFSTSGQYGTDADYNDSDPGNVWSDNVWDDTGQSISS